MREKEAVSGSRARPQRAALGAPRGPALPEPSALPMAAPRSRARPRHLNRGLRAHWAAPQEGAGRRRAPVLPVMAAVTGAGRGDRLCNGAGNRRGLAWERGGKESPCPKAKRQRGHPPFPAAPRSPDGRPRCGPAAARVKWRRGREGYSVRFRLRHLNGGGCWRFLGKTGGGKAGLDRGWSRERSSA